MHDSNISEEMVDRAETLLKIFAHRAVAEMERETALTDLKNAKKQLQVEREDLAKKNVALKEILQHLEGERIDYKQELASKAESLILPAIEKLKKHDGQLSPKEIVELEDAIKVFVGKDIDVFQRNVARLTGREFEVCGMIRDGLSSKEIAEVLTISVETVNKHRDAARRKLQVKHSNINLTAYLRSKSWPAD
jgi:DNA-binding CsgD family transcriptional regulator